jgi:hypothetical protein
MLALSRNSRVLVIFAIVAVLLAVSLSPSPSASAPADSASIGASIRFDTTTHDSK